MDGVLDMGFHVISRLRDDAYFQYLTREQPTGKKGQYNGKIDIKHLEEERFETGITHTVIEGISVPVYDIEKSVCDAINTGTK